MLDLFFCIFLPYLSNETLLCFKLMKRCASTLDSPLLDYSLISDGINEGDILIIESKPAL